MKRAEYLKQFEEICQQLVETTKRKNHDYAGFDGNDDAFANFRQTELEGLCDVETGIMVRLADKRSRVLTFIKKGVLEVADEKIEDTLVDQAVYSLILALYIRNKKQTKGAK